MIQVRLQLKLVDRIELFCTELRDQIDFDLSPLLPRRFFSPVSLPKGKVAVSNEPFKGY